MGGILRITILLCLLTDLSAQTITFNKKLPFTWNNGARGYAVKQTFDKKYIIGALNSFNEGLIINCNEYGDVQWLYKISSSNTRNIDVESDDQGNFFTVLSDSNKIKLIKLNYKGNVLWTKYYGNSSGSLSILKTDLGRFIITGASFSRIAVMCVDENGKIIWEKKIGIAGYNIQLKKVAAKGFAILCRTLPGNHFYMFDEKGDSLWYRKIAATSFVLAERGFLLFGDGNLSFMDNNGNLLWTKVFGGTYNSACAADDGNYVFAGEDICKVSILGEKIWTVNNPYYYTSNYIISTSDQGFVLLSSNYLRKIDKNGICKSIDINYTSTIPGGKPLNIYWDSENIELIDLEFSSDHGKNWMYIAENIADTGNYTWQVPEIIAENAMLKISDVDNPLIADSSSFSISYNLTQDYIAINQIKMWMDNSGSGSHDWIVDGSGLLWPGGKDAVLPAVFADGLVWGGLVNGQIRVNGSTYRSGLRPGKILENGKGDDPGKIDYNLWRLIKEWETLPEGVDRNRYEYNYNNWPAEMGAPFDDVNGDGRFTRNIDKPKIYGDETFWFVANDSDTAASKWLYGSDPIGLEMQCTVYGYNRTDELADVLFKHYKLINHSGKTIEKMCLGCWSDPDFGYAEDDYVGCDSTLAFGFVYNGDNLDEGYYGGNPPAAGYKVLDQGKVTGFIFYMGGSAKWSDPPLGRYDGSIIMYNYLNTKMPDGSEVRNPLTDQVSRYWLSGDPVAGIGWYQGAGWPGGEDSGDMRMMLVTGPTQFNPQDTLELTIAIILARGSDNINSIKELKRKATLVQEFYDTGHMTSSTEHPASEYKYELEQNYPNPFNPSTTIKYSVPERTTVELRIFDVLGKEVTTLVNEEKMPGTYQISFKAEKFSSGVYYYQLKTDKFISSKKMILLK